VLRLCGLEFVAWLVPAQPQCQALWTGVAGVPTVRLEQQQLVGHAFTVWSRCQRVPSPVT
jgi:hypothetical protein